MVVGNFSSLDSNRTCSFYRSNLINLKTCKMNQTEKTQLESRKEILNRRHSRLSEMYHDDYSANNEILLEAIKEIEEEIARIINALTTKLEYLYNFKGGGWNSEYAYTVEEAIQQAKTRWDDNDGLRIDETTFRVSSPSDYQTLLSLFY